MKTIQEMAQEAGLIGKPIYKDGLEAFAKLVREDEREACANICETLALPEWPKKVRQPLAQAIRARSNT